MPRLKINNNAAEEKAVVIAKTENDGDSKDLSKTSNKVVIACHLQTAIRFDNIPCNGGVKSIVLPGINDNLRGQTSGILLGVGHSVAVTLDAEDWEHLKRLYGNMTLFKSQNGLPPCIMEMKGGKDEFENSDEVKAQLNGCEPLSEKKIIAEKIK